MAGGQGRTDGRQELWGEARRGLVWTRLLSSYDIFSVALLTAEPASSAVSRNKLSFVLTEYDYGQYKNILNVRAPPPVHAAMTRLIILTLEN